MLRDLDRPVAVDDVDGRSRGADGVPLCCEVKAANTLPSGASVAIAVMNALLWTGNASRSRTRSWPDADGAGGAGTLTAVGLELGLAEADGFALAELAVPAVVLEPLPPRAPGNQQRRAADQGDGKQWTHSGIVGEAARQAPYVVT